MAIDVVRTTEQAECVAVSAFTMDRLGLTPALQVRFTEAVPDRFISTVVATVASDSDPTQFVALVLDAVPQGSITDQQITTTDGTVVGTVQAFDVATRNLTLAAPTTTALQGVTVQVQQRNAFGIPALRPNRGGASWAFTVNANASQSTQFMGGLMVASHIAAVLAVLPHLGITDKTAADVQAAVLASSDSLESILATQFEQQLEEPRRQKTLPPFVFVGGLAV